jgi:hypothetical protein
MGAVGDLCECGTARPPAASCGNQGPRASPLAWRRRPALRGPGWPSLASQSPLSRGGPRACARVAAAFALSASLQLRSKHVPTHPLSAPSPPPPPRRSAWASSWASWSAAAGPTPTAWPTRAAWGRWSGCGPTRTIAYGGRARVRLSCFDVRASVAGAYVREVDCANEARVCLICAARALRRQRGARPPSPRSLAHSSPPWSSKPTPAPPQRAGVVRLRLSAGGAGVFRV